MLWLDNLLGAIAEAFMPNSPEELAALFERRAARKVNRAVALALKRRRPHLQLKLAAQAAELRKRAQELRAGSGH